MLVLVLAPAGADELGDAMNGLCDKMKQCARENMAGQSIPPEMHDMVERMLDESCAKLGQSYGVAVQGHELYRPAVTCMNSLQSLSCAEIQDQGQYSTQACKDFEKASEKFQDPA
jgi:hypothetical protein